MIQILISVVIIVAGLLYLVFYGLPAIGYKIELPKEILGVPVSKKVRIEVVTDIIANPIEVRNYPGETPDTWSKISLEFRLAVKPNLTGDRKAASVGIIFLSGDRLYTVESELQDWMSDSISISGKPLHHRILHHSLDIPELTATNFVTTQWHPVTLSTKHSPWMAAVYVLPEDSDPQWFQLNIGKDNPTMIPKSGSGVSVRSWKLTPVKNPIVSAGEIPLF